MNLMLDFETLGSQPNAVVLSLGAVLFDYQNIKAEKEWFFDAKAQIKSRCIDGETLAWWLKQGDGFASLFAKGSANPTPMLTCLNELSAMAKDAKAIWSNGADFDIPIVLNLYSQFRLEAPWKFWQHRCYRTLKLEFNCERDQPKNPNKHDALSDARHQAKCLINFWNRAGHQS